MTWIQKGNYYYDSVKPFVAQFLGGIYRIFSTTDPLVEFPSLMDLSNLESQLSIPLGSSLLWPIDTNIPSNFAKEDGSAISRVTYADLFAIYGVTFGVGDGATTFNIRNMSGVVPRGLGTQNINGRAKTSAAITVTQEDQLQGLKVNLSANGKGGSTGGGAIGWSTDTGVFSGGAIASTTPVSDGVNGTPRTGLESIMSNMTTNFIVRIL